MAEAQKLKFPRALTFKDILESTKVNEIVAARDRESFAVPWRRVMLKKVDESTWLLLDENGTVLDEPDDSCPCKGFSQDSLPLQGFLPRFLVRGSRNGLLRVSL